MQQTTMMGFLKMQKAAEVLEESVVESNSSAVEQSVMESSIDTSVDCIMPSTSTASTPVETLPIESKSTRLALSQEECEALEVVTLRLK